MTSLTMKTNDCVSSVHIVVANDCDVAKAIRANAHKALVARNEQFSVHEQHYKDFKTMDAICAPQNKHIQKSALFVFVVSPYLNGKQCRSIRRFQRKLDNFKETLHTLKFVVVQTDNDARQESTKLFDALRENKQANAICSRVVSANDELEELVASLKSPVNDDDDGVDDEPQDTDTKQQEEEEDDDREHTHMYDACIAFGTQTGNAQHISDEIVSMLLSKHNACSIHGPLALNKLSVSMMSQCRFLVIVVSTTGDGEVPHNADIFYRRLKMKCMSSDAQAPQQPQQPPVEYAILGLGDSNYSQFNAAAKKIDKCLSCLCAHKFYHTGYADDGIGLEDVVEPWKRGVVDELHCKLTGDDDTFASSLSLLPSPLPPSTSTSATSTRKKYELGDVVNGKQTSNINFSTKIRVSKCVNSNVRSSCSRYSLFSANANMTTTTTTTSFRAYDRQNQFLAELVAARYETAFATHGYTDSIVVTCTFRLPHGYTYNVGDVLCVYAPNPDWMVQRLLRRLKLCGDDVIKVSTIHERSTTNPVPHIPFRREITLYDVFRFCVDIRSIPKSKLFLQTLSTFCRLDCDQMNLLNLAQCDLSQLHVKFPTLFDLLHAFASCQPSLQCLVHFLSELKPRQYSICSSPSYKPDEIDICVRILKHDVNVAQHALDGLCSCFLYSLCTQRKLLSNLSQQSEAVVQFTPYEYGFVDATKIGAHLKLSTHFKPPINPRSSLIMIGPGTGVAVFRGFLQHRYQQNKIIKDSMCDGLWRGIDMQCKDEVVMMSDDHAANQTTTATDKSQCVLFFGCRHPNKDYLFEREWQQFQQQHVLHELFVAFSRAQKHKVYVQHLLKENSAKISQMILQDDAYVFVCGDAAAMAKSVESTFIELIALHSKMSILESTKFIQHMKQTNKYNIDVWSSSYK